MKLGRALAISVSWARRLRCAQGSLCRPYWLDKRAGTILRMAASVTARSPKLLGAMFLLAVAMANPRSQAHIPGMVTIVQCNCGAEYRRTEEKFLVPHTGDAICAVCGGALESWSESTHVPIYELIERPDRKPE